MESGRRSSPNTKPPKRLEGVPEPVVVRNGERDERGNGNRDYEDFVLGSKESREWHKDPESLGGLQMGLLGGNGLVFGV